eukprot:TRINITY_DN513_c0_g1_i1.p2 TRINITY_DN513_c0_g1~~TRINITY_DN513_c0_g1_i1.p2  ORF type:complete len:153 (-),score=45.36 TRINITY_DN513_c0_g1_i1:367-825(-)
MGIPARNWLAHLENHESSCDATRQVELGLIDARYARNCEEYWQHDPHANAKHLNLAVSNYKSAAVYFRKAYDAERTPHIYQALNAAASEAEARAEELDPMDPYRPNHGCQCDVCAPHARHQHVHQPHAHQPYAHQPYVHQPAAPRCPVHYWL